MPPKFKLHPPRRASTVDSSVSVMSRDSAWQTDSNYLRINMILNPSFTLPSDTPTTIPLINAARTDEHKDTRAAALPQVELPGLSSLPERTEDTASLAVNANQQSSEQPTVFPAYEYEKLKEELTPLQKDELQRVFEAFDVVPRGRPGEQLIGARREFVPYRKDESRLILGGFHILKYSFRYGGEERTIAWDRTYGLMRLSACFKATSSKKTDPKKALEATGNLWQLTYNLTGGITERQGYWVPFECARALCKKFCYRIRYLLVPVFGYNFINECLHENDPGFGDFRIDPAIVARATKAAKFYTKTDAQLKAESKARADKRGAANTRNGRTVAAVADANDEEHVAPTRTSAQNRGAQDHVVKGRCQKKSQNQARGAEGLTSGPKAQETEPAQSIRRVISPSSPDLARADDHTNTSSQTAGCAGYSPGVSSHELATRSTWTSINQIKPILELAKSSAGLPQVQPAGTSPFGPHRRGLSPSSSTTFLGRADSHVTKRRNCIQPVRKSKHRKYESSDSPSHSESDDEDIIIPNKRQRTYPTPVAATHSSFSGLPYSNEDREGAEILLNLVSQKLNEHFDV